MRRNTQATTKAQLEIGDEVTVNGREVTVSRLEPFENDNAPRISPAEFGYVRGHDADPERIEAGHVGGVASVRKIDNESTDDADGERMGTTTRAEIDRLHAKIALGEITAVEAGEEVTHGPENAALAAFYAVAEHTEYHNENPTDVLDHVDVDEICGAWIDYRDSEDDAADTLRAMARQGLEQAVYNRTINSTTPDDVDEIRKGDTVRFYRDGRVHTGYVGGIAGDKVRVEAVGYTTVHVDQIVHATIDA